MNHAIGMPWTQQLVDSGMEANNDGHGEEDVGCSDNRSDTEETDKAEISRQNITCHTDQTPHSSENVNGTAWTGHYKKSVVGEVQDQLVKCPHCARHCRGKHVLKSHIENVHMEKPLDQWEQCLFCGRKCKTRRYLTMHILRVHRIRQRRKCMLTIE
jgi:Pyruvate/2-oxoacid:ferredoxin oxidoreductase delta subunit